MRKSGENCESSGDLVLPSVAITVVVIAATTAAIAAATTATAVAAVAAVAAAVRVVTTETVRKYSDGIPVCARAVVEKSIARVLFFWWWCVCVLQRHAFGRRDFVSSSSSLSSSLSLSPSSLSSSPSPSVFRSVLLPCAVIGETVVVSFARDESLRRQRRLSPLYGAPSPSSTLLSVVLAGGHRTEGVCATSQGQLCYARWLCVADERPT